MYGFGEDLTKENIFKRITSYDIFRYYSKGFVEVDKSFISDFRSEKNPSCRVSFIKGDLLYTDFGANLKLRAVDFVMELENLSYAEALQRINRDFNLGLGIYGTETYLENVGKPKLYGKIKCTEKKPRVIQIKARPFNKDDAEFWNEYSIQLNTLNKFNICAISNFWIDGLHYFPDKLSYSYNFYFEDNLFRRKIYQPLNSKFKWFSNGGKVVQGEVLLPKQGDLLIITKSFKDILCLYEMGYTAIAPTSESSFVPDAYFEKQQSRFTRIVGLYDNDDAGRKFSKKFSETYKIPFVEIPLEYGCKDISDYTKEYGKDKAINLLKELI